MKLSFPTILFITLVIIFSVFVANISNLIAIKVENVAQGPGEKSKTKTYEVMDNTVGKLFWFIQITDIHISVFQDKNRILQFREFCELTINTIKPPVVLATGDLTDAKQPDNMGSTQQLQEWLIYSDVLQASGVTKNTVWLDIRGNHDNFNIPSSNSGLNYYREYTVQGQKNPHSYLYVMEQKGVKYGFLGIDACLTPGPKRPFNFIGMLNYSETETVKQLIQQANKMNVNYTFAFGHYPTSCIISKSSESVRTLISSAPGIVAYMCGHFHTLGGMVPNMYTLQQNGFLELELGDWKDNRLYRIAAVDHGLLSFIDVKHGDWPVILVTNPKHTLFNNPYRESLLQVLQSTHIRVLVFSISPIKLVQVRIDGGNWFNLTMTSQDLPLYTVPWIPSKYKEGLHTLHVYAVDEFGREKKISQPFALDGSRLEFKFWPRLVLMSNVSVLFQSLFGLSLFMCVVPLCVFRILNLLVKKKTLSKPKIYNRFIRSWVRRFWVLSSIDRIFYPLVIYNVYLSFGPWTIGEVIDGYIGAVFAWGLVVNNSYLPGSFTYAYGFLQMCTFQFPLTVFLSFAVDKRFRSVLLTNDASSKFWNVFLHLPFLIIIFVQMASAYFFWLAYGTLAFFLGPLRTWSILLALMLWYFAHTLPPRLLSDAALIWSAKINEYQPTELAEMKS